MDSKTNLEFSDSLDEKLGLRAVDDTIGIWFPLMEKDGGSSSVPRPLESLQCVPIPPFLMKIYDLVDDPAMDRVISWGARGESFVVWDAVEFSRAVLPRHFKHNNFSSFVRQLNTYGFRKIDTERWEFANEDFLQGKRHMLRNIHRRKPSQIQPMGNYTGPSIEASKSGSENELEQLRRDRKMLTQELVKLHQDHQATLHQMKTMNQRLQTADQRQKQMVLFMAKVLQNPTFLDHLHKQKEQREITAARVRRKFLKQLPANQNNLGLSEDDPIVTYKPDMDSLVAYPVVPSSEDDASKQHPDYLLQDMVENFGSEVDTQIQFGNVASENLGQELVLGSQGSMFMDSGNFLLKGKGVTSPQKDIDDAIATRYFVSFPEYLSQGKTCSGVQADESIIKEEESWDVNSNAFARHPSPNHGMWEDIFYYSAQENQISDGFWDMESQQAEEGTGTDKLADDFFSFPDFDTPVGHKEGDDYKSMDI